MIALRIALCALIAATGLLCQDSPTHVILTTRVLPERRTLARESLRAKLPFLRQWRDGDGAILGFQVLANSLLDDESWDSMVTLQLTPGGLNQWRRFDVLVPADALSTRRTG